MPSSDEQDGILDWLGKKLFASESSPFSSFADQQRAERLAACRQLEDIVNACHAESKNGRLSNVDVDGIADPTAAEKTKSRARISRFFQWNTPKASQTIEDGDNNNSNNVVDEENCTAAEKTKSRARISRFFQWDTPKASQTIEDGDNNNVADEGNCTVKSKFSQGCHKEIHELWACRALALGCGGYLGELKEVWNEESLVSLQNVSSGSNSEITFEDRKDSEAKAREIQQMMAKCVTKNASELAERLEARRNKK
jgi:hypothetical protein